MRVAVDCIPGVDACQFAVYVTSEPGSGVTVHWLRLLFPHMSGLPLGSCCCCCCRCSVPSHLCQIQPGLWWCQVALSHLYALFVSCLSIAAFEVHKCVLPLLNLLWTGWREVISKIWTCSSAQFLLASFCLVFYFWGQLIVASTTYYRSAINHE